MAEPYSGLEVAHTERVHSSPEVVDYSHFAPQPTPSHDSPSQSTFASPASHTAHDSLLSHGYGADTKNWPPPELSPPPDRSDFDTQYVKKEDTSSARGTALVPEDKIVLEDAGKNNDGNPHRRKIFLWIVIGLVALIALVVGVGIGVGVGLRNKNSNKSSESSSVPTPTPGASDSSLPHGLMDDTSVAIVVPENGNKRLFFQENSGSIRQALYDSSAKQWTSDVNNMVVTNAKNVTPIVAFLPNTTSTSEGSLGPTIWLFYIADNNQLASRIFVSGTWTTRDNFSPSGSGKTRFQTANDTRALAVTSTADGTGAWLFYVAQNGTAIALNVTPDGSSGLTATVGSKLPSSMQGDRVLGLAAGASTGNRPQVGALVSNGSVYYSLYFSFWMGKNWSKPQLQTLLFPPLPADERPALPAAASSLTLQDSYPATATSLPIPSATVDPSQRSASYNESLIGDVNIAQVFIKTESSDSYTLFGFWVNGTSLAAYTTRNIGLSSMPKSPFPYSRLAGTAIDSDIFLYHQINETSIAEDVYKTDGGFFTTNYMNIAVSTG